MPNNKPVRKAVIAAAGLGTRFLPQTKAMPKEMLPIIDKPVIQIVVEEAVAAGVTDIMIVTGSTKRSIEDHFDRAVELEEALIQKGKNDEAAQIRQIAELANFIYIRQKGTPSGNARPVLNCAHLIDDEPFFVFFADDFFRTEVPRAKQLLEVYEQTGKSVISAIKVPRRDANKYGMIELGAMQSTGVHQVNKLIEKPGEQNTPSDIASVGGYLLTPDIMPILARETVSARGEIELSEAINVLAQTDQVFCKQIEGRFHDTGSKLTYMQALIDTGLADSKFGPGLRSYLEERLKEE
jgi:UTP--glucose-1-phosphate uridylyltransferase